MIWAFARILVAYIFSFQSGDWKDVLSTRFIVYAQQQVPIVSRGIPQAVVERGQLSSI
jgi:hypothetical protein